jgi:hypothetical protein
MQGIFSVAPYRSSFEDEGISLVDLSNQEAISRDHITIHDSLRSPPIAQHLNLVDQISVHSNADFLSLLMDHINGRVTPAGAAKPEWIQLLVHHQDFLKQLGSGAIFGSGIVSTILVMNLVSLSLQMNEASAEKQQALKPELYKASIMMGGVFGFGVLSLILMGVLEAVTHNAPNNFNAMDQNVDLNALNNQPQNTHARSINSGHIHYFQSLQALIPNSVDKTLVKDRILNVFDYLCEGASNFKKEMIALHSGIKNHSGIDNLANVDKSDAEKLQSVKDKVQNAIDFMIGELQADRTPMDYPSIVTTSAVLTHVWSCIEHLSIAGYENESRLLTENLMKALFASDGHCNTGHVSRILQAFGDTIHFGFHQDDEMHHLPLMITPQDFYTLHQNDLNDLVSDVVNTQSIRAQLHALEQTYGLGQSHDLEQGPPDRSAYKEAATLVVQGAFSFQLERYLAENHAPLLESNPALHENLIHFLETDFPAFIDNARNEDDMQSVASFSPV